MALNSLDYALIIQEKKSLNKSHQIFKDAFGIFPIA